MVITIVCLVVFLGCCYVNVKITRLSNKMDNFMDFIDLKFKANDLQLNIREMKEELLKRGGGSNPPTPPPTPPAPSTK
jgi:hypothetical protein